MISERVYQLSLKTRHIKNKNNPKEPQRNHVNKLLGWPKSLFGFSATSYGKIQTNFLANPIHHILHDNEEIIFKNFFICH